MYLLRCSILLAWSTTLSVALPVVPSASNGGASAVPPDNTGKTTPMQHNAQDGRRTKWSLGDTKLFSPGGAAALLLTGAGVAGVMDYRTRRKLKALSKERHNAFIEGFESAEELTRVDMCFTRLERMVAITSKITPEGVLKDLWDACREQSGLSDDDWAWGSKKNYLAFMEYRKLRNDAADTRRQEIAGEPTPQEDQGYQGEHGTSFKSIMKPIGDASKTFLANVGPNAAAAGASFQRNAPAQLQKLAMEAPKVLRSRPLRPV